MTIPHALAAALSQMPALAELFRLFLSGKHLNRMAEPALWAELEQHEASYVGLFAALGFELRLDARGFAVAEPAGWRLLPAVYRYLDHFESLALTAKTDGDEPSVPTEDDWAADAPDDEENT